MTTTLTDPVIDIEGLRKTFGSFAALDGLDLPMPRAAAGKGPQ